MLFLQIDAVHADGRPLDAGVQVAFEVRAGASSTTTIGAGGRVDLSALAVDVPLKIDVTATVHSTRHWDFQASTSVMFRGLKRIEVLSRHTDFEPPRILAGQLWRTLLGGDVIFLRYFVSRVRDAMADVLATLQNIPPANRPPSMPQPQYDDDVRPDATAAGSWNVTQLVGPTPTGLPLVSRLDVSSGALVREAVSYAPFDTSVLSIKGQRAPGLVAMTWPQALMPQASPQGADSPYTIPSPPFFFYVHPTGTVIDPAYDKSWLHLYASLWRDMNFIVRPSRPTVQAMFAPNATGAHVQDPFIHHDGETTGKGIAYQVAASGKACVYVHPLVNPFGEGARSPNGLPSLMDPAAFRELLQELQGFTYRRASVYAPLPPVGGLAISSFSRGANTITDFVHNVASHKFFERRLAEFIVFEAPHGPDSAPGAEVENVLATLTKWAAADPKRCVRIYSQYPNLAGYSSLVGGQKSFAEPTVADSPDGRRTIVVLASNTFKTTLTPLWGNAGFDPDPHNRTPTTMVLHALRRSRFTEFVP